MSVERTSAASSTELYNSTSLRGSGQRAPRYSISEMAPSKPTEVFVNKFAPATELSGAIQRTGEAFQYLPLAVPSGDIPGRYLFTEEGLQQYAALEHAFAEFKIELTGGESPTLRRLKEQMGEQKKSDLKSD